jgi:PAP2 superfamily/Wax ester synthase/diacylglycerol acyltransferase catalytic domain/WS/DGAT C-terminal domain
MNATRLRLELAIGLAMFGAYVVVELLAGPARRQSADQHALAVMRLQERLGIDVEPALNRWLIQHPLITKLANYEYAISYLLAAALLLVWAYQRHPHRYPFVRNSFVGVNLLGIACFLVYPLTPPRLLPGTGMVDTVLTSHTWGSWGSPMVEPANHLAAMPSLHVAWALWVSVMLAGLSAAPWIQLVSAAHVVLTTVVIMATANHFFLDAAGGVVAVWLAVALVRARDRRSSRVAGQVVPSADAFFWYVESGTTPQQVGGLALFAPSPDDGPDIGDVRRRVQQSLEHLPAFRRRLDPGTRWRRPRWVGVTDLDLDRHVCEHDLSTPAGRPGGMPALLAYVAGLAAAPMPIERPMWRVVIVRGVAEHQSALVLLAHHTIADGLGVVASALRFFDPQVVLSRGAGPPAVSVLRRGAATVVGIAQLATDGTPKAPLSATTSPARQFATAMLDLDVVRALARRNACRLTDVLLYAVAAALGRQRPDLADRIGSELRVAVPLVADPAAATGNVTAGVMVDLPLRPMPPAERLAMIAARTGRLRTPSRALASRLVMARGLALAPAPAARWFARTVYGRRFFHAIVSTMTGSAEQLSFAGARLADVVPIIPLAPGAPLALGVLGWNGRFGVGVTTDPAVVSADRLCEGLADVIAELAGASPHVVPGGAPQFSARKIRAR